MDSIALVNEDVEFGAEFLADFGKAVPVNVALWAKPAEASQWYLYVASDQFGDANRDDGYRELFRLADLHPHVDPFRVRLISSDDPLAKLALDVRRRFRDRPPMRFEDKLVGATFVEGAYVYPELPATSPA